MELTMPRFRANSPFPAVSVSGDDVRSAIEVAIRPGNWFVDRELRLAWTHGNEEVYWELFRGHALDHTKTRRRQSLEAWSIIENSGDEPLLSIRLDPSRGQIYVTRSILCRTWEGYVEGGEARSRETTRRVRELVGSIDLSGGWTLADLHDELNALVFFAVVGTSRLPLTSLEAPLPEFTLGQLTYCFRPDSGGEPVRCADKWLRGTAGVELSPPEQSRRLEIAIRTGTHIDAPAVLYRAMFNDIALSPYTDFVARTLALLGKGSMGVAEQVDLLTHLLRQNARQLTSFDLIRFRHRRPNYPDALQCEEAAREVWRFAGSHT